MATKDGKEASDKEIYELWWEYLKRSKKFKEFCEQMNELGEDHFGDYYSVFAEYMRSFGNIFNKSVEDWLNEPRRRKRRLGSLPVLDLREKESYRSLYFNALTYWNRDSESFPSQKKICEIIKSDSQYIFLAVPVVGKEDMVSISKQIKKIRDSYKQTAAVKEADKELRKCIMVSAVTRLRYDEIKFYLKVYDLYKQLTMPQVIERLSPSKDSKSKTADTEFRHFEKKARTIIENVERGFFPGKY
jgi:hypothetical protein